MAWKNQNRLVDSRTCKHLKEHLGEKFETARCNMGSDASTSGSRASRSPAKAKAIPQLLLAHKWTERFSLFHTFEPLTLIFTQILIFSKHVRIT